MHGFRLFFLLAFTGLAALLTPAPGRAVDPTPVVADGSTEMRAPAGHHWAKQSDGSVAAVPSGRLVPLMGTIRYRCACHITDEEKPCNVVIDSPGGLAQCIGSCGELKPCRWKGGPGPEEPEDPAELRGVPIGPGPGGTRVAPTGPKRPAYLEQETLHTTPSKAVTTESASPPAPSQPPAPPGPPPKPGMIWVDDHWERPRAK
jgi:hypothetical protein